MSYIYGARKMVTTMEQSFITRKQSLEEEIKLAEWMYAFEHRTEMRQRIRLYLNQVQRELLNLLR